ncbi:MAG: AsmA family protein [Alphaproteobacteria bacterium]
MGRWIRRIALGLGALVFLAVAAAATFVLTFDADDYRQEIADAVEAATGRKLHFGGKLESSILTLRPAITLHDAALLNPPGFSRAEFAKAKRVHLILRLRPLLQRRLAIVRLEVEGADVLLETNDKGERNWRQRSEGPGLTPAPIPIPVPGVRIGAGQDIVGLTVDRLSLENARVAYLHAPTKLESQIHFDEVRIVIPSATHPIELAAAGTYQGATIKTVGRVGSLDALLNPRPGPNFPVALKIAFGRSELEIDLKTDPGANVPVTEGTVTAKMIDLDELDPPGAGAATPSDRRLFSATPLPLAFLNAFDAKGEVNIELLVLRRQRLSGVAAKIVLKDGELTMAPFAFTMAGARVQGDIRVSANSAVPAVALKANGTGVRLREVTQLLFERATLSSSLAFSVNVTGRGHSLREIASGLNGAVIVAL